MFLFGSCPGWLSLGAEVWRIEPWYEFIYLNGPFILAFPSVSFLLLIPFRRKVSALNLNSSPNDRAAIVSRPHGHCVLQALLSHSPLRSPPSKLYIWPISPRSLTHSWAAPCKMDETLASLRRLQRPISPYGHSTAPRPWPARTCSA